MKFVNRAGEFHNFTPYICVKLFIKISRETLQKPSTQIEVDIKLLREIFMQGSEYLAKSPNEQTIDSKFNNFFYATDCCYGC